MIFGYLVIFVEEAISKREEALDYIVPQPHALVGATTHCYNGKFPELNGTLLEGNISYTPQPSPWKQRHRRLRPKFQKVNFRAILCIFRFFFYV